MVLRLPGSWSTVVSAVKGNVLLTNASQCGFCSKLVQRRARAGPNFAPLRWRIWLPLSKVLCLLTNQNVTFVTLFCTQSPFFCTVLPKNCTSLNQSQSRIFFLYIINTEIENYEPVELNTLVTLLDHFYAEVNNKKGEDYEPESLMMVSHDRHYAW